ncbi:Purine nucleoside phosphorylase 2 [Baekduia alba]|uniref:purine-nucleoside phosphorylase n=1 Tax=Baekduia alba TaxID=2997333 RepID=UPI00233FA90D|nr:purine-nucleoside phosphorylase [Baekduia alba]WCB92494.1 Purine nucleoside phosphorylase 2 [Baekduia alba]
MTAADVIREAAGADAPAPRLALVLGSGLGGLAEAVQDATAIPYKDLPGFPVGSVAGHAGRLVLGTLEGTPVVVLQGRAHLYEGIPASDLAVPVRTVRALGAETLVLTNAAGSINPAAGPGAIMALTDHINMMGANPLAGPNDDRIGPRFVGLGDIYDTDLRGALHRCAQAEGVVLHEGVYLAVLGPSFETPAEIRAFRTLGADAVGMSTVPEAIVARHCGLRVAAVSAITNLAEGLGAEPLSHEHTLKNAAIAAQDLQRVLSRFVKEYN